MLIPFWSSKSMATATSVFGAGPRVAADVLVLLLNWPGAADEVCSLRRVEESKWAQRAKVKHIQEGGSNTR
jgi:hypothetical protein